MVVDRLGHKDLGNAKVSSGGYKYFHNVTSNGCVDWKVFDLFPVGYQLIQGTRFENIARQDMCPYVASLLDKTHRKVPLILLTKLSQSNSSAEASGSTTDDQNIVF